MASRSIRRQFVVVCVAHAFVDMMWNQFWSGYPDSNERVWFISLRTEINKTYERIVLFLKRESGGLTMDDMARIEKGLKAMRTHVLKEGEFSGMMAVAFTIDLVVEQLSFIKQGQKRVLFEELLVCIQNFENMFDPDQDWEDPKAMDAAEAFRQLEI